VFAYGLSGSRSGWKHFGLACSTNNSRWVLKGALLRGVVKKGEGGGTGKPVHR